MSTAKRISSNGKEEGLRNQEQREPFFACFGRHTGYGGYGNWERGARQVVVDLDALAGGGENGEGGGASESGWKAGGVGIETWVRLERGGVSGHVVLNETYGEDTYPEIAKSYTRLDDKDEDESEHAVEELDDM